MLNHMPGKAKVKQPTQKISRQHLSDAIAKGRLLSARFVLKTDSLNHLQSLHNTIGPLPTAQKVYVIYNVL